MQQIITELNDRILRADGVIVVNPDKVEELFIRNIPISKIRILSSNEDTKLFNILSDEKLELFSDENIDLDFSWNLPEEYKNLNLDKYVQEIILSLSDKDSEIGEIRINNEFQEFKRRNLLNFLKTIIFIVSEFKSKNIVWGVGRGSSCASYLLYKIGLHSVDCLKYNIPYTEFFHD